MPASDRRARASSIRCVSRVRLQKDRKSLRQAFGTLLKNSSVYLPVLVLLASAKVSFPAPSVVSGKAPAHLRYRSQTREADRGAAELRWPVAGYPLSERQRACCCIWRRATRVLHCFPIRRPSIPASRLPRGVRGILLA